MSENTFWVYLRAIYRLGLFVAVILSYLAASYFIHVRYRDLLVRRRKFSENVTFFCRWILKLFNMHVKTTGMPTHGGTFLIISNHMGFIDILMLASHFPMNFVTSQEMRETPFLGLLTEMGGCIYVERRNRTKVLGELHQIAEALKQGFRVTLYPEATSHNGEEVLPFKRTLLMAAAHAGVPLQPVVVNFRKVNGEPITLKWRDSVCWYGDISFVASLWASLKIGRLDADIDFLDPYFATPDEDRGVVASNLHAKISAHFTPIRGSGVFF